MSDASISGGVIAARPTIAIGGQDQPALAEGLLSLLISENCQGLYRCEATFGNWGTTGGGIGFLYFDRQLLDFGKSLTVKLGAASSTVLFEGRITALEAQFPTGLPSRIVVLAEDRFQDLRMTRRTRSFEQISDADVIRRIAGDHGLRADVDVSGPPHRVLTQVNQSDLAFLRERAREIDAELWMDGQTLHAQARARRSGPTLTLRLGSSLRECSVLADLAHQRSAVVVSGWDVAGKEQIRYEATEVAIRSELNGDTGGARILSDALGERKEALVHTVPLTSQEAQTTAEAVFRVGARRFLTARGAADPDPQLRVGSYVELTDLGPLFSGKYYVSGVQHMFDQTHGMRAEFLAERPGLGQSR
jgi:phage protein D